MKRIITLGLAMMIAFAVLAQKNVTQFLGIPVDGTKTAMIQKLKDKGFTYNAKYEYLEGEFNGRNVVLVIATNNNKVWRIMIKDASPSTETNIKIRYNTLCRQFEKNSKYIPQDFEGKYEISDDVDLSYEIMVNKKRYEAAYYQVTEKDMDSISAREFATERIMNRYSQEELEKMSEEDAQKLIINTSLEYLNERIAHKSVWFMINREYGDYYILMYYDNELNHSNGEDL